MQRHIILGGLLETILSLMGHIRPSPNYKSTFYVRHIYYALISINVTSNPQDLVTLRYANFVEGVISSRFIFTRDQAAMTPFEAAVVRAARASESPHSLNNSVISLIHT